MTSSVKVETRVSTAFMVTKRNIPSGKGICKWEYSQGTSRRLHKFPKRGNLWEFIE